MTLILWSKSRLEYFAIEYVWIDIACIQQTPNSREMAAEVGRQAKIFRGAE